MRLYYLFILCFVMGASRAQTVTEMSLPAELADPENQFSSLYIYNDKLFMLSESRLDGAFEQKLYSIRLIDIDTKLKHPDYPLPVKKIPILNLDSFAVKINEMGNKFEGMEALVIYNDEVYINLETTPASPQGYIIAGKLYEDSVVLNTQKYSRLPKPAKPDGSFVFNAGFESLERRGNYLVAIYEYNSFASHNVAYKISLPLGTASPSTLSMQPMPYRITDVSGLLGRKYVGIQYFYPGDAEKDYRPAPENKKYFDKVNKDGVWQSYAALVKLKVKRKKIIWREWLILPSQYHAYNWEAIAKYKKGFLLMNDKFAGGKKQSVLAFLQP